VDLSEYVAATESEGAVTPLFSKADAGTRITMSIAYLPETGEIVIDGSFKGGADGRMLLEMAATRLLEEFPKP